MSQFTEQLRQLGYDVDETLERFGGDEDVLASLVSDLLNAPFFEDLAEQEEEEDFTLTAEEADEISEKAEEAGLIPMSVTAAAISDLLRGEESESDLPTLIDELLVERDELKKILEA